MNRLALRDHRVGIGVAVEQRVDVQWVGWAEVVPDALIVFDNAEGAMLWYGRFISAQVHNYHPDADAYRDQALEVLRYIADKYYVMIDDLIRQCGKVYAQYL